MRRLKLATYDIDKNNGDFPDRIFKLSNIIYKNKLDILCLQDDFTSNKFSSGKFLNLELDYNYITTTVSSFQKDGVPCSSNLTILSKIPIELIDEIYFNQGKENERACQFVKLNFNDFEILLINSKLCPIYSLNRNEQINIILKKIDKYKREFDIVFFCGNFYVNPSFPEIKRVKDFGFKDKNKEFTHKEKIISDYIFNKSRMKLDIESKIILKEFSSHHCLVNIFKFN